MSCNCDNIPIIKWLRMNDGVKLPEKNNPTDSGFDIRSEENITIHPRTWKMVSTGIKAQIPKGYEIQVRPRSGLAYKYGISVINSPGTVDEKYRGEIKVLIINNGIESFPISRGDRIAQLVLSPVVKCISEEIKDFNDESDRGELGFGSSGVK